MDYPTGVAGVNLDPVTGKFGSGNAGTGVPASTDRPDDMNQVFDEMRALITEGGLNPDHTVFTQVRDAIRAMFDNNDPNPIVNGDMQIAQRPAANINSSSFGFGTVDRWAFKSTGTITGGGAIQQAITTLLGSGGFAVQVANLSTSTAGSVIARHRMESSDSRRYKNAVAIIKQIIVYQDTGLNQNYTIAINKANAQDNFSAVTNVGTSGNIVVPSGVATPIWYTLAPGDVSNGIEIQVTANFSAAIAGKNFYFTDSQIHLGNRTRAACNHPNVAEALNRCRRYALPFGDGACGWYVNGSQLAQLAVAFGATMRTTPTCSVVGGAVSYKMAPNTNVTCNNMGASTFDQNGGCLLPTTSGSGAVTVAVQIAGPTSPFLADAEL